MRCVLALIVLLATPAAAKAAEALPQGFVYLRDVDASIREDIRYAGQRNFMGARVTGYSAPRCILTRPAAAALARAQAELRPLGLSLKVFDCYRPQRAVIQFVHWAESRAGDAVRAQYHPRLSKAQLLSQVYIAMPSGHSRGSTLDLTIVSGSGSRANPAPGGDGCSRAAAVRDAALDMGTGFDCFDPRANTADARAAPQQRANRMLLKSLMERHGFRDYEREWWHYTLNGEPFAEKYFDFEVR